MRSAPAPSGGEPPGADRGPAILAEGVSKQYPGRRVLMFPPVLSIFERDLSPFRGRRASEQAESPKRPYAGDDLVLDEDDEDEDEDDERDRGLDDDFPPARPRPDELFWALKDVSLSVRPGAALGVLGGPDAGKSTLLRILSGRAFPTEGRVLVRGPVAPLPAELHKALAVSGKKGDDLVLACRLLGVDPQLVKPHQAEIEELAAPLVTPEGDPVRGARTRLAFATCAVLPTRVVLIEDTRGLDDAFIQRVFERLRERVRNGSSLVLASRQHEFVQALCDEVIVLDQGSIVDRGATTQTAGRYVASAEGQRASAIFQSPLLSDGRGLSVPPAVAAFNELAALLSVEVRTAAGVRSKVLEAEDELVVEIRVETAAPDTELHCGVSFTPRSGETSLRVELPEALRLAHPSTYLLEARIPPGTLPSGGYEVRADAIVAAGAEREASVIARSIGRFRIAGDELPGADPAEPPVTQWDGSATRRLEAEWSIE